MVRITRSSALPRDCTTFSVNWTEFYQVFRPDVPDVPAGRSGTHLVVSDEADAEFGAANVIVPHSDSFSSITFQSSAMKTLHFECLMVNVLCISLYFVPGE
jgi:hypothetical protein